MLPPDTRRPAQRSGRTGYGLTLGLVGHDHRAAPHGAPEFFHDHSGAMHVPGSRHQENLEAAAGGTQPLLEWTTLQQDDPGCPAVIGQVARQGQQSPLRPSGGPGRRYQKSALHGPIKSHTSHKACAAAAPLPRKRMRHLVALGSSRSTARQRTPLFLDWERSVRSVGHAHRRRPSPPAPRAEILAAGTGPVPLRTMMPLLPPVRYLQPPPNAKRWPVLDPAARVRARATSALRSATGATLVRPRSSAQRAG